MMTTRGWRRGGSDGLRFIFPEFCASYTHALALALGRYSSPRRRLPFSGVVRPPPSPITSVVPDGVPLLFRRPPRGVRPRGAFCAARRCRADRWKASEHARWREYTLSTEGERPLRGK